MAGRFYESDLFPLKITLVKYHLLVILVSGMGLFTQRGLVLPKIIGAISPLIKVKISLSE